MKAALVYALLLFTIIMPAKCSAQDSTLVEQEPSDELLVRESGNPITSVLNLPVRDDVSFGIGEYDRTMHHIRIQPVRLSVQTGRLLKIRSRSIIPFKYLPDLASPDGGVFGLGDIIFTGFLSPDRLGRYIWGIGPAISIPTATDPKLGTGKWSLGFSLAGVSQRKNWLLGFIFVNLWSVAGKSDRPDVSAMQTDFLIRYHLGDRWMLVSSPTITANWEAPEGEQWLVPVGGGIGRIWRAGRRAFSIEIQAFYFLEHPESFPYPDWSMRFQVQFIGIRRK
jgi:hypothetical protein